MSRCNGVFQIFVVDRVVHHVFALANLELERVELLFLGSSF